MQTGLFAAIVYFYWDAPADKDIGPVLIAAIAFCMVAFVSGVIGAAVHWLSSLLSNFIGQDLGDKRNILRSPGARRDIEIDKQQR